MSITLYGIPNCDTIKKTTNWLKANNIPFEFHNYKTEGISKTRLNEWCKQTGWEIILNKKSNTWKSISEAEKASAFNTKNVVALLSQYTSMIKRPVITLDDKVVAVGYDETVLNKIKNQM